ncbi:MAG TPA: hypothetical protein VGH03_18430 [Caulobacteraceae bacterium]
MQRIGATKALKQEVRAWSLNLVHDSVLTNVVSYGHLDDFEKADGSQRDEKMEQLKALAAAM